MKELRICEEFTDAPGGRLRSDGPKSGEEFRGEFLVPFFNSLKGTEVGLIDLDGCFGYATSFLEESFGGLARMYGAEPVLKKFEFKSDEEPNLIKEIKEYITNANQ